MGILLRVDDKLCHGQVTYLWIKKMKIDRLMIADDRLVADNFSQVILKLSKPAGVEQEILTVRAAIKRLAEEHRDENLLVLVGSIENAWQIGAVRQHRGSRACSPHIYLDDEELEWCKNMIQSGIQLECRYGYDDPLIDLSPFLG